MKPGLYSSSKLTVSFSLLHLVSLILVLPISPVQGQIYRGQKVDSCPPVAGFVTQLPLNLSHANISAYLDNKIINMSLSCSNH